MSAATRMSPENLRAALALGPLEAVCNVCGRLHALPRADQECVGPNLLPCLVRRALSGIALARVESLSRVSCECALPLEARAAAVAVRTRCDEAVPREIVRACADRYDILDAAASAMTNYLDLHQYAYAFDHQGGTLLLDWTALVTSSRLASLGRLLDESYFARIALIDPTSPRAAWALAPRRGMADREIARIYLDALLDGRVWAQIAALHDAAQAAWRELAPTAGDAEGIIKKMTSKTATAHARLQEIVARA